MAATSKHAADSWDRVLDAAEALSHLIMAGGIRISEDDLEELTIFLAANGQTVRHWFKDLKKTWSSGGDSGVAAGKSDNTPSKGGGAILK